jgi:hypothetical protein
MRQSFIAFSLLGSLYSLPAMASTLTATCQDFEGQAVQIQQGEEPVQKLVATDQTKITLQIDNESGKGDFKMWVDGDSEPIEGQIFMEAPPANKLRVFSGLIGGMMPISIGLYHEPDKMIYSTFTSMPKDYKNPDATADHSFLLQGDLLYGDCVYK